MAGGCVYRGPMDAPDRGACLPAVQRDGDLEKNLVAVNVDSLHLGHEGATAHGWEICRVQATCLVQASLGREICESCSFHFRQS